MENLDIASLVPIVIGVFVLIFALLIILNRIFVNVGAREIAIKERRYLGAKMPPGRVVATEGEVGIQADVLKPGLHLIKFPFERVVRKVPLIEIGADELGDGSASAGVELGQRVPATADRDESRAWDPLGHRPRPHPITKGIDRNGGNDARHGATSRVSSAFRDDSCSRNSITSRRASSRDTSY